MSTQPETAIALDELFSRLYNGIRGLAAKVRWNGANPTLNPTALAHEAYLRLQKNPPDLAAKSHEEIIGIFAHAMRQILIEAARRKQAQKRSPVVMAEQNGLPVEQALTVALALEDLERSDAQLARIAESRFLLGMTTDETAAALKISQRTVERGWQQAKQYLGNRIQPEAEESK